MEAKKSKKRSKSFFLHWIFTLFFLTALFSLSACKNQSDDESTPENDNKEEEAEVITLFPVNFIIDGDKQISCYIQEGQYLFKALPEEPKKDGYKFMGWSFQYDRIQLNDLTFYRVYYGLNLYAVWLPEIEEISQVNFSGVTVKTRLSNPDFYWIKAALNLCDYYVTPFVKEEGKEIWSKVPLNYSSSSGKSLFLSYSGGSLDFTKKYEARVRAFSLEEEKNSSLSLSESENITINSISTEDSFARIDFSVLKDETFLENGSLAAQGSNANQNTSLQNDQNDSMNSDLNSNLISGENDIEVILLDSEGNRLASKKAISREISEISEDQGNQDGSGALSQSQEKKNYSCSWYGLENRKSYSLLVVNQKAGIYKKSTSFTPEIGEKEKSDYLFLCYMAADNNLDPFISLNFKEMERSLSNFYTEDGELIEGKPSVNIIALFDGDDSGQNNLLTEKTGLFKLGADFTDFTNYNYSTRYENFPECLKKTWHDVYDNFRFLSISGSKPEGPEKIINFGKNTKNLTYTGAFTREGLSLSELNEESLSELNSASPNTLSDFLSWAKERFEGDKTFILISSHGSGPRALKISGREISGLSEKRAVTQDDSNGNSMGSMIFAQSLKDAGFCGQNKAHIIIFDSCYSSSLEDDYELRETSSYMLASPNSLPGMGLPYYSIINSLQKDSTTEGIGKNILNIFKDFSNSIWLYQNGMQESDEYDANLSLTLSDLSEAENTAEAFSDLGLYLSKSEKLLSYLDGSREDWSLLRAGSAKNIRNLYYQGNYSWLYDTGVFIDGLLEIAELEKDSMLKEKAEKTEEALSKMITSSFKSSKYYTIDQKSGKGSLKGSDQNFYQRYSSERNIYGLTITGGRLVDDGKYFYMSYYPAFYDYDLSFGIDTKWIELLRALYPTGS